MEPTMKWTQAAIHAPLLPLSVLPRLLIDTSEQRHCVLDDRDMLVTVIAFGSYYVVLSFIWKWLVGSFVYKIMDIIVDAMGLTGWILCLPITFAMCFSLYAVLAIGYRDVLVGDAAAWCGPALFAAPVITVAVGLILHEVHNGKTFDEEGNETHFEEEHC